MERSLRAEPEKRLAQLPEIPSRRKRVTPICIQTHAQGYVAQRDRIRGNVEKRLSLSALWRCIITITLIVLVISITPILSYEAGGGQLATANNSVNDAFSSVYYAEQNGGDVSALVEKLNTAVSLIQRAIAENATDPNLATADLSNATTIAQMVSLNSTSVSTNGSIARQLRLYESLGTVTATLGVAALTYLRGDRVYRRLWLYLYRNHVVKKSDE